MAEYPPVNKDSTLWPSVSQRGHTTALLFILSHSGAATETAGDLQAANGGASTAYAVSIQAQLTAPKLRAKEDAAVASFFIMLRLSVHRFGLLPSVPTI